MSDVVLTRLGDAAAEAVARVLRTFCGDAVEVGTPTAGSTDSLPPALVPCVAASVAYVDGATGGNIFTLTVPGARKLAAAMMGTEPESNGDLSELELSSVSEAMNQMMAAAAEAVGALLGEEIGISAPETKVCTRIDEIDAGHERTPYTIAVPFSVFGEPSRLVQLVPNALVVQMMRALDAPASEISETEISRDTALGSEALLGVSIRLWVELG